MLPPELTDTIIDYLYDDRKALSKCGRVSRSWVDRARLHLWRKIVIDSTHERTATLALFLAFIQHSPATVKHIQHLELSLLDYGLSDPIISKLALLSSLKTLTLSMLSIHNIPAGTILSASVETLIVSHLEFTTLFQWHSFITALPNVEVLVIGEATKVLRGTTTGRLPDPFVDRHLQRLDITLSTEISESMYGWINTAFSSVKTVRLKYGALTGPEMGVLWSGSLATMEHLEIDAAAPPEMIVLSVGDLAHAARLSTITAEIVPYGLPVIFYLVRKLALSRLPSSATIDQLLIALHPSVQDTKSIGNSWLGWWEELFGVTRSIEHDVCRSIVIRAVFPLQWDEHLLAGLEPLQRRVPLRVEQRTQDGRNIPITGFPSSMVQ